MSAGVVALWVQWVVAVLLVTGALLALIGAFGLLRLRNFFQRIHAPALGNTLGTWVTVAASVVFFSSLGGRPVWHEVLIGCFIFITAPVTSILLVRAALARDRRAGVEHSDGPAGKTGDEDDGT